MQGHGSEHVSTRARARARARARKTLLPAERVTEEQASHCEANGPSGYAILLPSWLIRLHGEWSVVGMPISH